MEDKYNIALWLDKWLEHTVGLEHEIVIYVKLPILLIGLIVICTLVWIISKKLILNTLNNIFLKTKITWDDKLVENRVFDKLAHIIPALVVNYAAPYVFGDFPDLIPFVIIITDIFIVGIVVWSVNSVLSSLRDILLTINQLKDKPIASYIQLVKIIVYFIGGILILSLAFGKNPFYFLSAMGAMTAVILLIFKDTILGFVASIQMSVYDMVRVGDWVSMPKYEADGDVVSINLNTVKVQNWDKTITTIPTYAFISDSFKNWRGMTDAGGRRIKRSIKIKICSIKFCDEQLVNRFKKLHLIHDYINQRSEEIDQYNLSHHIDKSSLVNGRHLTNVGVFRVYAENYIRNHPKIHQGMTIMVRQLEPTEKGLPIEIYCFSAEIGWVAYEGIMADIFDHLLAAIPEFDLEVFEEPTGRDFMKLGGIK
jgi:miniconductance mechanosensitive channel